MENQLVTILRITRPQVGSFVKSKLEEAGIECFFTNEGLALGSKYNPDEVLLKVKANQSEIAVKTLLQIHQQYNLDKIHDDISYRNLKKILVPVKLVQNCIDICKYALILAREINAEVKLLYVYPDPIIVEHTKHTASWKKHVKMELQEAHRNAESNLLKFSKEVKNSIPKILLENGRLHYRMLKGNPEHVIAEASERYAPDVILMGSKKYDDDQSDFKERIIAKVIEGSNYPVLVVPGLLNFKEKGKLKIMYATDFYEKDNSSLNKLLNFFQTFEKEIHCVHIELKDDKTHRQKVDDLNAFLAKEYSEHNIHCKLIESKNLIQGFNSFAEDNNIDIISFSKRKRSSIYKMFHTSLLEKLVSSEKVPVLIFPV